MLRKWVDSQHNIGLKGGKSSMCGKHLTSLHGGPGTHHWHIFPSTNIWVLSTKVWGAEFSRDFECCDVDISYWCSMSQPGEQSWDEGVCKDRLFLEVTPGDRCGRLDIVQHGKRKKPIKKERSGISLQIWTEVQVRLNPVQSFQEAR